MPSIGYVLDEPVPTLPLNTKVLIPLLQKNAAALAAQDPPVKHPLSLLSKLQDLPPPAPITLPSGDVIYPPEPSGEPSRKLVIFGDCSGGTPNEAFERLCTDASLLIHECTNAAIPESVLKGDAGRKVRASDLEQSLETKRDKEFDLAAKDKGVTREPWVFYGKHESAAHLSAAVDAFDEKRITVRKKAQSRGHSAPEDVGEFAFRIRARRVAVNHFSAMFPSPHYKTNEAFPSLLGPASPLPYAAPTSLLNTLPAAPLTADELHIRVIMQSLASQISAAWNGPECADHVLTGPEPHFVHLAVASRDFMVLRVPSHELGDAEIATARERRGEIVEVMRSWADEGGAWVWEDGEKRWVGVEERSPGSARRRDEEFAIKVGGRIVHHHQAHHEAHEDERGRR